MEIFKGSAVALITPFDETGAIDWPAFDALLTFHLENQTDALVITGTTGEVSTLTDEEQINLIKRAVEVVEGKIPIIAGTGINDTRHTIELSTKAEVAGADALLLVTPYYNKANHQGMLLHFTKIADAVSIPIILYHVPGRTGATLTVEQVVELAQHPNIVAIKDATGDLSYTKALAEQVDLDQFAIYSGNDDLIYDILALGGKGVISVLANILPQETHQICQSYFEGDTETSHKLQNDYARLIDSLFVEVNPIPVKYMMHLMGYNQNTYRLPLWEPSEQVKTELESLLPVVKHYKKGE
ncbi:4-hydroxy-tetrahydrodipicolinate synthase [Globicatella sp. PHS-GS-PNBC-21-1553]|uniref:4-hydroxy-tetrahydrodipicolinate synthase n=1 Tax=Globicatella sp. PHS-GS-PNBC-21-1553 TaxID=2885764 RepID=UPI00298F1F4E|nr:4-hydroxy-tetrahydrodipicolinate synthase [Globicatella sp. PHS-GS-PNBC-21-1553]WPC08634.1 4-hydroxy-tetrahydrodipicolinate synthase [Globicatella sp. PHS-GS-PNBC-21-1553]